MALDAGFGRIHPLMAAGQRSRGAKERRKSIGESAFRAAKADGIRTYAPVGLVVPLPAGAITMSAYSLAAKTLQTQIVYPEIQRPVSAKPWTPVVERS
jgi:hypothetical protein